jgi:hypothetical protein
MRLDVSQQMRMDQRMVLAPRMIQSMEILQLPLLALQERNQQQMAEELQRVGKRYFIQTPNFYFPLEPHFLFPLFQFFPLRLRVFLIHHFDLGWFNRITNKRKAAELVNSIRLLKKGELKKLFPKATIKDEKFLGLTISFIVLGGWQ